MEEHGQMEKPLSDLIDIIHFTEDVSAKIHGISGEGEIYRIVKEEFVKSKRYTMTIMLLTDDISKLRIAETSQGSDKLKAAEKLTGLRLKEYVIDLNKSSIFSQVIREGKTVQVNFGDLIGEMFPRPLADLILKAMGYEKRLSILTPLKRKGKIVGTFAMTSTELAEYFIPSVKNLAQHISTALELADEMIERKSAEEKLRESEQRYRCLVEDASTAIVLSDLKGRLTYVNKAAADASGYSVQELIGHPFIDFIHPDDRGRVIRLFLRIILLQRQPRILEFRTLRKDGSVREAITKPTRLKVDGKTVGFEAIILDITDHKKIVEALRESEEKYKSLVDNVRLGIFRSTPGPTGKFLEVNPAMEEITGYSREELLSMNVSDLYVHPEEREEVLEEIVATVGKVTKELNFRKKNGAEIVVSDTKFAVRDNTGKALYFDGIIEDITERKKAEDKLKESEEKYRKLYETINDGIVLTDMDGRILECNQAYADMLGYFKDELKSLTYQQLTPKEWHQMEAEVVKEHIVKKGYSDAYEKEYIRKDGTVFPISIKVWLIRDGDGKPKGMWGIVRDITERRKAELQLRESEEKLRRVLESSPNAITVTDLNGKIIECNQATLDQHGYSSKDEVIGKSAFEWIAKKDHERAMENLKKTLEEGSVRNIEYTLLTKDGREFPAELSASVIKDASGNPTSFVAITKDITERKRIDEMKSTFITKVTHELKTPITSIKGCASHLRSIDSGELKEDMGKMLEIIERNSERLLKLTNDMLDLRMIEEGKFKLKRETVDVAKMLNESIQEVLVLISKKNQKLVIEIPEDLPPILGDSTRLSQVVYNLLSNASKFTPDSGCITVRAKEYDVKIFVEVSDTGIGINREDLKRVFDLFPDVKKPDYFTGMGIGLNICKEIIQMHGGEIWAESEGEGKGSKFIFTLPVR